MDELLLVIAIRGLCGGDFGGDGLSHPTRRLSASSRLYTNKINCFSDCLKLAMGRAHSVDPLHPGKTMPTTLQASSPLTAEDWQQLEQRLRLFPPSDVDAFKSGVKVLPKHRQDKALFDWVMRSQPPIWYASWVLETES
ncbi:hypothetical protein BH23CYA1_BH23CYA1_00840 [soil metagenome]